MSFRPSSSEIIPFNSPRSTLGLGGLTGTMSASSLHTTRRPKRHGTRQPPPTTTSEVGARTGAYRSSPCCSAWGRRKRKLRPLQVQGPASLQVVRLSVARGSGVRWKCLWSRHMSRDQNSLEPFCPRPTRPTYITSCLVRRLGMGNAVGDGLRTVQQTGVDRWRKRGTWPDVTPQQQFLSPHK